MKKLNEDIDLARALPLKDTIAAKRKRSGAAENVEGWLASAELRPPADDRASAAAHRLDAEKSAD